MGCFLFCLKFEYLSGCDKRFQLSGLLSDGNLIYNKLSYYIFHCCKKADDLAF